MKNKNKEFRQKIFLLYGKVLKGDVNAIKEFKEIYFSYYPSNKFITVGHWTKQEYLHVMYNHLCKVKL